MNSEGTKVLVLGMGASGCAAARLLCREGADVTIIDAADGAAQQQQAAPLRDVGVEVMLGAHDVPDGKFDLAVVSPGIPKTSLWLQALTERGVHVMSELELGWSRRNAKVLAVTGSNGKSTVVVLLCHILTQAGLRAAPAGNFGPALCDVVQQELDWLVVEVSSFQMEWVDALRAEIGILLNVQPNHLDRHGTMDEYLGLKARLFAHTGPEDLCLVPVSMAEEVRSRQAGQGAMESFGTEDSADWRYADGAIWHKGEEMLSLSGTRWANPIMGPAMAAVAAAAQRVGVDGETTHAALQSFTPLPHRMELVGRGEGITFVNDSKATTLSAMAAGISICGHPVRLIAGGIAKEHDFSLVVDQLASRVRGVYLIGQAAEAMQSAWGRVLRCRDCGTLPEAFAAALRDAVAGETILLSPGCASFDQFRSFEERGECFRELVAQACRESDSKETGLMSEK